MVQHSADIKRCRRACGAMSRRVRKNPRRPRRNRPRRACNLVRGGQAARPFDKDTFREIVQMKNTSLILALGAALAAASATSVIAHGGAKGKMGPGPHHAFEDLDTDGDGAITSDEMASHQRARFDAADSDGDGMLSQAEMIARMQARLERRTARMIERYDADGDGKLAFDEMRMRFGGRMFARVDADGDGSVSKEEFEAMRARGHGRHGMHGGHHGHGH